MRVAAVLDILEQTYGASVIFSLVRLGANFVEFVCGGRAGYVEKKKK